jgi:hypothetical protein
MYTHFGQFRVIFFLSFLNMSTERRFSTTVYFRITAMTGGRIKQTCTFCDKTGLEPMAYRGGWLTKLS